MPAVARKNQVDIVQCIDGTPGSLCSPGVFRCDSPSIQATLAGSDNVRVNGIGVVREDDVMKPHPAPECNCPLHQPVLTAFSSKVFVNGKRLGRLGDLYTPGHVIASGSSNVFDGSPQTSG